MLLDHDPCHAFLPYPGVELPRAEEGPLSGLTVGIKDIYDVAGYPTGSGCPLFLAASGIKRDTAPAVQRLLDAGARCVGKTHTDELAWSMYGLNAHFGTPLNSAAPDHIPGGSSSGSAAAVAGGLVDLALGSDTGGSVRAPASFCALWGIRPTHGSVPMDLVQPVAPSFDTPGLFARDAQTLAKGSAALCGDDPSPLPDAPAFLRPDAMLELSGPEARAIWDATFGDLPSVSAEIYPEGAAPTYDATLAAIGGDARDHLLPLIAALNPPLVHGIDGRVAAAAALTDAEIAAAGAFRAGFADHIQALLGGSRVILAPVLHAEPFRLDPPRALFDAFRHDAQRFLCVAGLAGLPQVVFPAGRIDGAPFGMSLIGPRGSDLSLIALARRLTEGGLA